MADLDFERLTESPESLARVANLDAACFADAWRPDSWAADLQLPHLRIWVAREAEADRGFACVSVVGDFAELRRIGVDPSRRRGGVGRWLLRRVGVALRGEGVERLVLEVRASNEAARLLYESVGFEVDRVRKGYYRAPLEDGVDMGLALEKVDCG